MTHTGDAADRRLLRRPVTTTVSTVGSSVVSVAARFGRSSTRLVRRVVGTVPEGDSLTHVLYYVERNSGVPVDPLDPWRRDVMHLRRSGGRWLLAVGRETLGSNDIVNAAINARSAPPR